MIHVTLPALQNAEAPPGFESAESLRGMIQGVTDLVDKLETQAQEVKRVAEDLRAIVCQRLVPTKDGQKAAAVEVMVNTPRIKDLIAKQDFSTIRTAIENGAQYHMQTFDQALIKLFDEGRISDKVAVEFADSRNNVALHIRLHAAGGKLGSDISLQDINDDTLA